MGPTTPIAAPLAEMLNLPNAGGAVLEQRLANLESQQNHFTEIYKTAIERAEAAEKKYEQVIEIHSVTSGFAAGCVTFVVANIVGFTLPFSAVVGLGAYRVILDQLDKTYSPDKG
ncbi:MAG: hypothetical protein H0T62_04140 [Parachlamydiaceae bacterium]|nr:hypothetical protein [Parachlamydiaceae bacterium]